MQEVVHRTEIAAENRFIQIGTVVDERIHHNVKEN
jgi:hypothetical protein